MARRKGQAAAVAVETQAEEHEEHAEVRLGDVPHAEESRGQPSEQRSNGSKKPVKRWKSGVVTVSVFENHHPQTGRWFSVVPQRRYQDDTGWHSATSFGHLNLLPLSQLLAQAWQWINEELDHDSSGA